MNRGKEAQQFFVPLLHSAIIRNTRFYFLVYFVYLSQIHCRITAADTRQQLFQVGLLVKVSTADEEIVVNDKHFISAVYSDSTYSVNKQLDTCSSHRAPTLVPYQSNSTTVAEVIKVRLLDDSSTYNRTSIVSTAIESVKYQLGLDESIRLGDFVDFVVFCVPTGLSGPSFLATGAYDSFWAVAKPSACTNSGILLHEFGHLLGLKHARQDEDEYGDESSVMGRTTNAQNRCFNGYNFWKLGWFNNDYGREIATSSVSQFPIKLTLAAFVDVSKLQSKQQEEVVVLKVDDLYLVYNRRKGYNNETGELPDMVTVVRALDTEESDLVIGLNETKGSNAYRYTNNKSQLVTIQTCSRHHGNATSADHFVVAIGMDSFPCESYENGILEIVNKAPSRVPIVRLRAESPAPTLRLRSVHPNVVIQSPTVTTAPDQMKMPGTRSPSKSEVYTAQPSNLSESIPRLSVPVSSMVPISTSQTSNRTMAPTNAPISVALNTPDIPTPTKRQSNKDFIGYTQSPFPPIQQDGQRHNDTTSGGGKRFSTHDVYMMSAIVSIFGLAFIAVALLILRHRKSRVANQQCVLPTKI